MITLVVASNSLVTDSTPTSIAGYTADSIRDILDLAKDGTGASQITTLTFVANTDFIRHTLNDYANYIALPVGNSIAYNPDWSTGKGAAYKAARQALRETDRFARKFNKDVVVIGIGSLALEHEQLVKETLEAANQKYAFKTHYYSIGLNWVQEF